jgi:hypothetical protein
VSASAGQAACIAFYPQDGREVLDYYLQRSAGTAVGRRAAHALRPVLPSLPLRAVRPYVEQYDTLTGGPLAAVSDECPVLFLLASHIGESSGTSLSRAHLARYDRLLQALSRRYASQSSRRFGWSAPVYVTRYSHWGPFKAEAKSPRR